MKLRDKIKALFKIRTSPAAAPPGPKKEPIPKHRPTPMEDESLSLDPADGWGIALEPAGKRTRLLNDLIEQLALEAYYNGEGFQFTIEELETRFLNFFDRMVQEKKLQRLEELPPRRGGEAVGPDRWIEAQQIRINRLVAWWQSEGGPDIEAMVL